MKLSVYRSVFWIWFCVIALICFGIFLPLLIWDEAVHGPRTALPLLAFAGVWSVVFTILSLVCAWLMLCVNPLKRALLQIGWLAGHAYRLMRSSWQ